MKTTSTFRQMLDYWNMWPTLVTASLLHLNLVPILAPHILVQVPHAKRQSAKPNWWSNGSKDFWPSFFSGCFPGPKLEDMSTSCIFFTHFLAGHSHDHCARQKHKIVDVLELFHQLECFIEDRRMSALQQFRHYPGIERPVPRDVGCISRRGSNKSNFKNESRCHMAPSKNIDEEHITPRKLTRPLKNDDEKTILLLKWSLFQGTCYMLLFGVVYGTTCEDRACERRN